MSLDKAIESGKEHRVRYTGSKAIDRTCRNHGGCPWCEENRRYRQLKIDANTKDQFDDWTKTGFNDSFEEFQ